MSDSHPEKTALEKASAGVRRRITEAFADAPKPLPDELVDRAHLAPHNSTDPSENAKEARLQRALSRLRDSFAGRDRGPLDLDFWSEHWACLCYFSPKAYRYYLPSLLLGSLDPFSSENRQIHWTISSLTPNFWLLYEKGQDSRFNRKLTQISPTEYDVVCSFLELIFDYLPGFHSPLAARALRWGWNLHETAALVKVQKRFLSFEGYEPSNDPEVKALEEEIIEAFQETPYPGDRNLIRNPAHCEEEAELAVELSSLPWRHLHPELLRQNEDCLSFFTPEGFRHILPAYLLLDLRDQMRNNDPVFSLTYFPEDSGDRYKALVRKERLAVISYLRYREKHDSYQRDLIGMALKTYWMPSISER